MEAAGAGYLDTFLILAIMNVKHNVKAEDSGNYEQVLMCSINILYKIKSLFC